MGLGGEERPASGKVRPSLGDEDQRVLGHHGNAEGHKKKMKKA